jgi:glycosyltransferase involved in cell wall biosynthesis
MSPIARYLLLGYQIFAFRNVLREADADALMVINGGYPGGESCRAAAISWGAFVNKPRSIHNYHSLVMKSAWYVSLQEYVVDKMMVHFTNSFVTVSRAAKDSMELYSQIFKRDMITYIHNGIDCRDVPPEPVETIRNEIGISQATPLCLMLGSYDPMKGHYFLFQAFSRVIQEIPDAHLLICGFGFPHEIKLVRKYVRDFQMEDNVHLMDFRKDLSHLLNNTDVLLVASQEYESFGFTSVEAMAHRVPVVATNIGGIPEVVADGEGGYCVDSRDPESFAQCVIKLLKDTSLRKEQGAIGYQRYLKHFTAARMSSLYAEMIHRLEIPKGEELFIDREIR